jgi:hypothetical protein
VADSFRDYGAAWRSANAGHVSLNQLKVMSAIERCRIVALGGHVARCEDCAHTVINAIVDALAELGVSHIEMPATPSGSGAPFGQEPQPLREDRKDGAWLERWPV